MRFRARAAWVGMLLWSIVGCSDSEATESVVTQPHIGDGTNEPEAQPPVRLDAGQRVVLIDDAEDADALPLVGDGLPRGHWFTFDDRRDCRHPDFTSGNTATCGNLACAASGMIVPVPEAYGGPPLETVSYEEAVVSGPSSEFGLERNQRAIRVQASAFTFVGAGVALDLEADAGSPYDLEARGFGGIRFLARSGISSSTIALSVRITDVHSDARGGSCVLQETQCHEMTCSCDRDTQGCFDHPTAPVTETFVTGEWQLYELPFSDFTRPGRESTLDQDAPPNELDPSAALQLQFLLRVEGDTMPEFDLWLDDIGFTLGSE